MMEDLWKDLPSDILERVATFLPLASVIRFTCVSKTWNALIHTGEFALRHARAAAPEHYVLVTTRYYAWETPNPTRHWEVLNTARTAFFTIRNDFLTDYVLREGIAAPMRDPWSCWNERAVLAADGGLVCVAFFTRTDSTLLVCNPLLRSVRRLPELEAWVQDEQCVVMATDRRSMEYQVFVIIGPCHRPYSNKVYVYESKTGAWRELSSSSLLDPTQVGRFEGETNAFMRWWGLEAESFVEWQAVSISCVRNKIYKLFVHDDISLSVFVSLDTVTGVVSEVSRPDIDAGHYIQLVVVQDRLFYIAVVEARWIQVFEVKEKACDLVTQMPDEFVKWVVGDVSERVVHDPVHGPSVDIISLSAVCDPVDGAGSLCAIGCGRDTLLFCSRVGRSVAYNLSRNMWDYYPNNGLGEAFKNDMSEESFEICGSNYFLSLCPP